MEVVASLSQGRTAAAQCGLFTHKSVPVIFETPCLFKCSSHTERVPNISSVFVQNPKCWVLTRIIVWECRERDHLRDPGVDGMIILR